MLLVLALSTCSIFYYYCQLCFMLCTVYSHPPGSYVSHHKYYIIMPLCCYLLKIIVIIKSYEALPPVVQIILSHVLYIERRNRVERVLVMVINY